MTQRRINTWVTSDAYAALEAEAERREMTAVSLAGMVLGDYAASLTDNTGRVCATFGHGGRRALGEASMAPFGDDSWHPYCGDCLGTFERAREVPVRRFPE